MSQTDAPKRRFEITVSWNAILRVALAVVLAYLLVHLGRFIEMLILALLIALTLQPIVGFVEKRGWPKWVGTLACALLLFGFVILIGVLVVPTLGKQVATLVQNLPKLKEEVMQHLPSSGPFRDLATGIMSGPGFTDPEPLLKHMMTWGTIIFEATAGFILVLVIALYFLADGRRCYEWLLVLLSPKHRRKVEAAIPEVSSVVTHYMAGQAITSLICGAFAYVVLLLFKVPNAMLLAVMAAVFDVLPMIGFFLFTIPAVLMAWTVSAATAAFVAVIYVIYHLVENYFIVPKVYGDRLRLSTLTVLIACLAAGIVLGVIGVIIVLPIVACYPLVERLWLRPHLQPDTVERHEEIERQAEAA